MDIIQCRRFGTRTNMNLIPENREFEEFLNNCKVSQEKTAGAFESLDPELTDYSDNNDEERDLKLYLSYSENSLKLDSILIKIEKILKDNSSPANRKIALCFLAIIVESTNKNESKVKHANKCLEKFIKCEFDFSITTHLKPHVEDNSRIDFGQDIHLGPFDPSPFNHWAERGRSNFRNLSSLKGRYCLTQRRINLAIPNLVTDLIYKKLGNHGNLFFDKYFHNLKKEIIEQNWYFLDQSLCIKEALSLFFLNFKNIFSSSEIVDEIIGIFRWKIDEIKTWAVRNKPVTYLIYPKADSLNQANNMLEESTGSKEPESDSLLYFEIKKFSEFLQSANRHQIEERSNEAFLFRVIALDLLFGDKSKTTENIAKRVSSIVHNQLESSYQDCKKQVKKMYDSRSNFVHKGEIPENETFIKNSKIICEEVLFCVLTVSSKKQFKGYDDWVNHIDWVHASLEANKELDRNDYLKMGLAEDFKFRKTNIN